MTREELVTVGKNIVKAEKEAIDVIEKRLGDDFSQACELILDCKGRVIVIGMGKSGHIGKKIAATMASTGTPAFFVHPGEASHGDLGMITKDDVVVMLSYSGQTEEVVNLLPLVKQLNVPIIGIAGKSHSVLAQKSSVFLDVGIPAEACPLNLAPSASTTATLVMGDALALTVMQRRGFTANDFARSHPSGALGKRLLLKVADIMHQNDDLPQVTETTVIKDALMVMTSKRLGMTAVLTTNNEVAGVFTDGDLRRALDECPEKLMQMPVSAYMTKNCITISSDKQASFALELLESKKINGLLVVDNNKLVGALNMHDILRAGL